jgi:2',3'-cyclic-nucleotide 2'-phosphodiesterase (5'-nucleotidase family)
MNFPRLLLLAIICLMTADCSNKRKVQKLEEQHYVINTNAVDSSIYYTILPYKKEMDSRMNLVVGYTEQAMTKDQPEGLLGNFVTDCLFSQCKKYMGKDSALLDCIVLNNGGLRTSLPQGEITVGKIFELMPFDNELTLVEIKGSKMQEMIQFLAEKGGAPVSGIRMKIENGKATDVKINGKELDTKRNYFVISSDYLVNGGDKIDFFKEPVSIKPMKIFIRDAIIEYCKAENAKGKKLNSSLDGRISIAK